MAKPLKGGMSGKHRKITQARVRDCAYYLGEDWIDYGALCADIVVELYRNIATSSYQPKKCPMCKEYWHEVLGTSNKKIPNYLKRSVFGGIPAEKEVCWLCSK